MIVLDIPETAATTFVVATAAAPDDARAAARARVRLPLAADLLGTSLVEIHTRPAGESGYADLIGDAGWARPQERDLLGKASRHILITSHAPPVSQPDHGQAARAIARAVAESCDGVVYDACSRQVLPHDFRFGTEHPEFCLADGWLALFIAGNRAGHPDGLSLTSAGLRRFALPELAATQVPAPNVFAAATLLRCLAVGLLTEHWDWLACHPGERTRALGPDVEVDARDVWRYWAAEPRSRRTARVRVRLRRMHDRSGRPPLDPAVAGSACPPEPAAGGSPRLPGVVDGAGSPGLHGSPGLPGEYGMGSPCAHVGQGDGSSCCLHVGPPADFGAAAAVWWNDVVDLTMPYVPKAPRRTAA